MTTKTVYLYDENTGEHKGAYEAHESPLEPGQFITPIHSSPVPPPLIGVNEVAVMVSGAWAIQPDFREQTIYDQTTGTPQVVAAIGTLPAGSALTPPPPTLAAMRISASVAIDNQAGAARAKYITSVAGQAETYLSKAADAQGYKAAIYPFASVANYPWVQAEAIAINGASPTAAQTQAAADGILAAQAQWVALGAAIEQARRAGKIAVAAAATVAAVQAAEQNAITALLAI
jgi:hypothetical protein